MGGADLATIPLIVQTSGRRFSVNAASCRRSRKNNARHCELIIARIPFVQVRKARGLGIALLNLLIRLAANGTVAFKMMFQFIDSPHHA